MGKKIYPRVRIIKKIFIIMIHLIQMYVAIKKAPRSIEFRVLPAVALAGPNQIFQGPYTAHGLDVPHPCSTTKRLTLSEEKWYKNSFLIDAAASPGK